MKLPINDPHIDLDDPSSSVQIWKLVETIFSANPNLKPKHVRLSPTTKKLLIRLDDGTTREQLESLKVHYYNVFIISKGIFNHLSVR